MFAVGLGIHGGMTTRGSRPTVPPARGSVVIYVDGVLPDGQTRFRIAEVVGPTVTDPDTGDQWMGVLLPARSNVVDVVDVIDCSKVAQVVAPP